MTLFLINLLTPIRMLLIRIRFWNPFIAATRNPRVTQEAVLRGILERNKETEFGQRLNFNSIGSSEIFRSEVPVHSYEDLRLEIERQATSTVSVLVEDKTEFFVLTSGTTSEPKFIPINRRSIKDYKISQHLAAYAVYRDIPGAFEGKILGIVSPAIEGISDYGIPYGSMSGLIYSSMPRLLRAKYVVPPEVFQIVNYEDKYKAIAAHALREPDITMIATANPTSILRLLEVININFHELMQTFPEKSQSRAAYLESQLKERGVLTLADIWEKIKAVTVWTGGNCSVLIPKLKAQLPATARIVEVGYMSSEFRGSITLDVSRNLEVPTIMTNFFEFVAKEKWEENCPEFKLLDEVEVGRQYYVFVTTQNGLYRYNINDIVEITGFFNNTPTIRFIQKGKGVVSLTGEKLHESQLVEAVMGLGSSLGLDIEFFLMLGCTDTLEYTLYLEHDPVEAFLVDEFLAHVNLEYASKRQSGRLLPPRIKFLQAGTGRMYREHCIRQGQRESQYKMIHLQNKQDCNFSLEDFVRPIP